MFAAIAAAWYAGEAARHTRDTLWNERAWITFSGINTHILNANFDDKKWDGEIAAAPNLGNTGRTPAININCYCDHKMVEAGAPVPEFSINALEERRLGVIGAGNGFNATTRVLSVEDTKLFMSRQKDWYIFFYVDYFDVFQPHIRRTSKACLKIEITATEFINGTIPVPKLTGASIWAECY